MTLLLQIAALINQSSFVVKANYVFDHNTGPNYHTCPDRVFVADTYTTLLDCQTIHCIGSPWCAFSNAPTSCGWTSGCLKWTSECTVLTAVSSCNNYDVYLDCSYALTAIPFSPPPVAYNPVGSTVNLASSF